ncbi:CHAT domain-containing protein [Oculatella sp. LEGE 06141]|uniref:CHAT domain-containing protein n=1 Tax=Oculatella sp. LEGE 06141 TaxID=1828648 RepID=UPI00187E7E47|nr:CHAT domain-containing protein [Oculatella sp. LEGE 06141]MBE9180640.1 CHAT domain-containing protein [Oculatella sp. LEGE 06141]
MAAISLVMTTYNREGYLQAAIASVLQQTRPDFELIIWDDGSTDDSVAIAQEFARRDGRIRVIAAPHLGRGLALKAAMTQASGQYIGWLDDDDILAATALEETGAVLDANPGVGLVYTNYAEINEQGTHRGSGRLCQIPYSKDQLLVDFMVFHFRLIRKTIFDQAGGINESFEYIEDYELCLRLSEITEIRHLPKTLYFYRVHPNSITRQKRQEQIGLCEKAINQALQRRGLDDRFKLRVQLPEGRFLLCRKHSLRSALKAACLPLAAFPIAWAVSSSEAIAQSIVPNRDGTGTVVSPRGDRIDITGGRTSGDNTNLFHSFRRFGLSDGEIANFITRPEVINVLGRINGGEASFINGILRVSGSNANLFLMNPSGIVFGPNATLDLPGSFTATTATGIGFGSNWFSAIGNNDYALLNGNPSAFAFTVSQPGAIVNAGDLSVAAGQRLGLLGGVVVNTGELSASGGQLTAVAVPGESMVRLSQPGNVLSLEIPIAPGSRQPQQWILPIASLPQLLTSNGTGQELGLQVNTNGQAELVDSGTVIPSTAGTVVASGQFDVSNPQSGAGGTIHLLGDRVGLANAQLNASGHSGGGTVLVGGDYRGEGTVPNASQTYVSRDSRITADATHRGEGGNVIVWADGTTAFYGTISAQGGQHAGNGGFAEVSGRQALRFDGSVNLTAAQGELGMLLLDPENITIFTAVEGGGNLDENLPDILQGEGTSTGTDTISEQALESQAANANIILEATNDITIDPLDDGVLNLPTTSGSSVRFTADADGDGTGSFSAGNVEFFNTIETQGGAIAISGQSINVGDINSNGGNISLSSNTVGFSTGIDFGTLNSGNGNVDLEAIAVQAGTGYGTISGNAIQSQGGNVTVSATDDVLINSINSANGDIAVTAGRAAANPNATVSLSQVNSGTGNITLTGNEIDFFEGGEEGGFGLVQGSGTLTLQPSAPDLDIVIGGSGYGNPLNLTDFDLGAIQDGFSQITIGDQRGSGNVTILGSADPRFSDPVTVRSPNGTINVQGSLIGTDNASITLNGATTFSNQVIDDDPDIPPTTLNAGITTAGQPIQINGNTTLNNDTTLNTGAAIGGNIILNGTVNGTATLALNAGTGQVNLNGAVGNAVPLQSLTVNGAANLNSGSITTTGDQVYQDPVTLEQNTTLTGNDITFNSTVDSANAPRSLAVNSNDVVSDGATDLGVTTFNRAVGGSSPLASLTTNAAGQTVIGANITTAGNTMQFNDPVFLRQDVTLTDSVGDIVFNNTVDSEDVLRSLTVNAPNGAIAFNGTVGSEAALSSLAATAFNTVTLGAPIITNGNITIRGSAIQAGAQGGASLNSGGGAVGLTSTSQDIEVESIATQGGTIRVNANRFFRATGILPPSPARPDNTSIDSGGGAIAITHAGGPETNPVEPFVIGDATLNGTAGNITNGVNTLRVGRSIPGDFTRGTIEIDTDDIDVTPPPPPPNGEEPPTIDPTEVVPPPERAEPSLSSEFTPPLVLGTVAALEDTTCREFQQYFGSETFGELAGGQDPCERIRTPEEISAILGTIAAQAGRRAAIIYLVDTPEQLEAIAFFPEGQPIRRTVPQANREALLAVVQDFRAEVNPEDISKLGGTSYLASAQQLYQWLITPIESELTNHNIDTLAFIPSSGLRSLPFAALHNGSEFLIEKYSVGLLPSINLIDPRYQSLQGSNVLAVGSGRWEERGFDLNDLPSVPIEIAAVVQQPWQGETLFDEEFTLPRIASEINNPAFRILHLATHGEFLPGDANDSYIQLWNARLGLNQLRQLQLNQAPVELLTLSACRTALGDESAELGFAGLALAAGVKSSLASLWYVSDVGTLGLMTEFYRELALVPIKAEALQQTQIAMLRGEVQLEGNQLSGPTGNLELSDSTAAELSALMDEFGVDDLSHPFFWAAFTMVGSPW